MALLRLAGARRASLCVKVPLRQNYASAAIVSLSTQRRRSERDSGGPKAAGGARRATKYFGQKVCFKNKMTNFLHVQKNFGRPKNFLDFQKTFLDVQKLFWTPKNFFDVQKTFWTSKKLFGQPTIQSRPFTCIIKYIGLSITDAEPPIPNSNSLGTQIPKSSLGFGFGILNQNWNSKCSVRVPSMFRPSSVRVPSEFRPCSVCVPSVFRLCSVHVPSMLR